MASLTAVTSWFGHSWLSSCLLLHQIVPSVEVCGGRAYVMYLLDTPVGKIRSHQPVLHLYIVPLTQPKRCSSVMICDQCFEDTWLNTFSLCMSSSTGYKVGYTGQNILSLAGWRTSRLYHKWRTLWKVVRDFGIHANISLDINPLKLMILWRYVKWLTYSTNLLPIISSGVDVWRSWSNSLNLEGKNHILNMLALLHKVVDLSSWSVDWRNMCITKIRFAFGFWTFLFFLVVLI